MSASSSASAELPLRNISEYLPACANTPTELRGMNVEDDENSGSGSADLFLSLAKDTLGGSDAGGSVKHKGDHKTRHTPRERRGRGDGFSLESPGPYISPLSPNHVAEQYLAAARRERLQHAQSRKTLPAVQSYQSATEQFPFPSNRHQAGRPGLTPKASFASIEGDRREETLRNFPPDRRPSKLLNSSQTPPSRAHLYRPSNLAYSSPLYYESTPALVTPPGSTVNDFRASSRTENTESAGSTTAASTIWDELDFLKSRIRKLELTGKLPSTSAGAIAQAMAERPRTGSTTVTTISSSPRTHRKLSPSPTEVPTGGAKAANVHPLLHQALDRARPLLDGDLYRAVQATAADALNIAVMAGSGSAQGTVYGASTVDGSVVADRNLRRKADSMCRSLTELCIALCEGKHHPPPKLSPNSNTTPFSTDATLVAGLNSLSNAHQPRTDPEESGVVRSSPSRALSRIEARRASLHTVMQNPNASSTPRGISQIRAPQIELTPPDSLHRTATTPLPSRRQSLNYTYDISSDRSRAPSRARTEIGQARPPTRDDDRLRRMSRKYTSQVPLPTKAFHSSPRPGYDAALATRRQPIAEVATASTYDRAMGEKRRLFDRRTPESTHYG